jgi:hypothetical protein
LVRTAAAIDISIASPNRSFLLLSPNIIIAAPQVHTQCRCREAIDMSRLLIALSLSSHCTAEPVALPLTPSNGGVTSKPTAYSFLQKCELGTQLPAPFEASLTPVLSNGAKDCPGIPYECADRTIAFLEQSPSA